MEFEKLEIEHRYALDLADKFGNALMLMELLNHECSADDVEAVKRVHQYWREMIGNLDEIF